MELINDKERRVLESLFKQGQSTVNQISKETLINRTALYHTLELLTKKGLLTCIEKDKISYFEAIEIDQYKKWVELKTKSLKESTDKDIERFSSVKKDKTKSLYADVKYFEGFESLKNMYIDTIYNNKEKNLYTITDYQKGYTTLGTWLQKEYLPKRVERGIRVQSILPNTAMNPVYIASAKNLLRELCFIDIFKDIGIEINLYDSKLVIVAFDETHPVGIMIQNDIITNAFREIFNYIWKTRRNDKTRKKHKLLGNNINLLDNK